MDLRAAGWSFGGVQAANFSWHIGRKGVRPKGTFKLDEAIEVQRLVTLDPVEIVVPILFIPVKVQRGSVLTNVGRFVNLYERTLATSKFERLDPNDPTNILQTEQQFLGGDNVLGGTLRTELEGDAVDQEEVNVRRADAPQERDRRFAYDPNRENAIPPDPDPLVNVGDPRWRLFGKSVNHNTLPWYAYARAIDELD